MTDPLENSTVPASGEVQELRLRDGAAAGDWLKQHAPALFAGAPKPLKLHIQKDIEARFPGRIAKPALTAFLRRHTSSTAYLLALTRAPHRFDLDGQPAGEISDAHKAAAKEALAQRRERQRVRDAEAEQARQWRADLLRDWTRSALSRTNFCALKGVVETALDALLEQAKLEAAQQPQARPAEGGRPGQRPNARPERRSEPRGPRRPNATAPDKPQS